VDVALFGVPWVFFSILNCVVDADVGRIDRKEFTRGMKKLMKSEGTFLLKKVDILFNGGDGNSAVSPSLSSAAAAELKRRGTLNLKQAADAAESPAPVTPRKDSLDAALADMTIHDEDEGDSEEDEEIKARVEERIRAEQASVRELQEHRRVQAEQQKTLLEKQKELQKQLEEKEKEEASAGEGNEQDMSKLFRRISRADSEILLNSPYRPPVSDSTFHELARQWRRHLFCIWSECDLWVHCALWCQIHR